MAQSLHKTKRRIASINSTKKITKAMELVSTVKLKKYRRLMENNERYSNEIAGLIQELFARQIDEEIVYCKEPKADKDLYVVLHSNFGLCAGYNNNLFNFVKQNIDKNKSVLYLVGSKSQNIYTEEGYEVNNDLLHCADSISMTHIMKLGRTLDSLFKEGKYRSVHLIYTHYVNSLKFVPCDLKLFPLVNEGRSEDYRYPPIFDTDIKTLIEELVPVYLNAILFQKVVESIVSEQTARRTAMENASDNADELIDQLTLEYNKARQAAITQEITEIVSGQL